MSFACSNLPTPDCPTALNSYVAHCAQKVAERVLCGGGGVGSVEIGCSRPSAQTRTVVGLGTSAVIVAFAELPVILAVVRDVRARDLVVYRRAWVDGWVRLAAQCIDDSATCSSCLATPQRLS